MHQRRRIFVQFFRYLQFIVVPPFHPYGSVRRLISQIGVKQQKQRRTIGPTASVDIPTQPPLPNSNSPSLIVTSAASTLKPGKGKLSHCFLSSNWHKTNSS
ncbi:unnamed protein product [Protopolystoma xenopodis]|uniref:Uncharacterized protein n=1 Tax=Protopolystoma xenopodis TaxID=117903 RepID=A0A448WN94_9PLAT|nr:unnamed protein product [Protopolystoma xenopodis]